MPPEDPCVAYQWWSQNSARLRISVSRISYIVISARLSKHSYSKVPTERGLEPTAQTTNLYMQSYNVIEVSY